MNTTTLEKILLDIVAARKAKKWVCCTYRINTDKGIFSLGGKVYGWWAQRIECCGITDTIPEQKTIKAFSKLFFDSVNSIVRSL